MGKTDKKVCKTSIGGQAVLEGVMMRGRTGMATAVRDPDGVIRLEAERLAPEKHKITKLPIIRGAVNFFKSMYTGVKILSRSAEVYGEDDSEPSKFEKWLAKTFKTDIMNVVMVVGVILGLAFSIGLFIVVPNILGDLFVRFVYDNTIVRNILEGVLRVAIFIIYILLTSLLKDIRRTYMYHGAEHKTITCYEKGLPLTVENVRGCRRVHDRCGTTFMFFVMTVSILVFTLVEILIAVLFPEFPKAGVYRVVRLLIKIAFLPLVAGLSYELLKALAKTDSPLVFIFKLPGLALQKITTKEPDDGMIEVAIAAFNKALLMDENPDEPTCTFVCPEKIKDTLKKARESLASANVDETDADWIICRVSGLKRSEIRSTEKKFTSKQIDEVNDLISQRISGRPLWYIFGNVDFYGLELDVDERVLIPRPETEEVVSEALKYIDKDKRVLDLCTGSGAIAAVIKSKTGAEVVASDVSKDALSVAVNNFEKLGLEICAIESDMFKNIDGKFDVIVSNPPYIRKGDIEKLDGEVKDHEPEIALDGGDDGLDFYRIINSEAHLFLNEGGKIIMEIGFDQAADISEIFSERYIVTVIKDIEGNDRIVRAELK